MIEVSSAMLFSYWGHRRRLHPSNYQQTQMSDKNLHTDRDVCVPWTLLEAVVPSISTSASPGPAFAAQALVGQASVSDEWCGNA